LCGRGWETGLSEFPQACFVFDEIHAFEPLLAGLTLATVKLLTSEPFNAKVLFASATLPRFLEDFIKREISINNVIEPDSGNEFDRQVCDKVRHRIEVRDGSLLGNLRRIADEIEQSGESALIVCNHVATSQEVYRFFKENGFEDITLLHSRFNSRDRNRIEAKITKKKSKEKEAIKSGECKPAILVATQAVEVSLDIDYERGYSEPAPADALGQRLGRINRSGNRRDEQGAPKPSHFVIFSEPSAGYLYDEMLTNRTVAFMRGITELTEGQLTEIVDKVYENGYPPPAMEEFKRGLGNKDILYFADEIIAGTYRKWTDEIFDKTDGQIEVLPDTLQSEFTNKRRSHLYIESNQLLVSIRIGQWHKAKNSGFLWYDDKIREFVTRLTYSQDLGLQFDS
jgi:CRISPR-associated endonuclease/helicase Cas3